MRTWRLGWVPKKGRGEVETTQRPFVEAGLLGVKRVKS